MNMDINNNVYIWVTDVKPHDDVYILDGRAFDDEFGFGGQDLRKYSGDILLISCKELIKINGELGLIHISRRGRLWTLNNNKIPETPFLLTNNININHKYSDMVSMKPSDDALEVFNRDKKGIYPIISDNFIGVITYEDGSTWLDAFSDVGSEIMEKEEVITFSEWDTEAGTIKRID
ncbi:MAG TPA: hypothetical protein PLZ08_10485 [Bacillota bacterium]|nr:hypothetical protein [Bacillota bacterium]HOL10680.1 hypothetical protein [Bacillota bacterium]HPO98365.1 hypothetical protein [Bacillota bacterium]